MLGLQCMRREADVVIVFVPSRSTNAAGTANFAGNPGQMFLGARIEAGTTVPS